MEIHYDKIKAETAPHGVNVIIPRKVGKDILLVLEGQIGPKLVTDLLRALEPHFPTNKDNNQLMSVIMTMKGFGWQAGLSADRSKDVALTIRPAETPGLHFLIEPERARQIGKALIELAGAAETPDTEN